jgi:hypothetical protein
VLLISETKMGRAFTMTNLIGTTATQDVPGVLGTAQGTEVAVAGQSAANGYGVFGTNIPDNFVPCMPGFGPVPALSTGAGVYGFYNGAGPGVHGSSITGNGVEGIVGPDGNATGVAGVNTGAGTGVYGSSVSGNAVAGTSKTGNAGSFNGHVQVNGDQAVTGTLTVTADIVLTGADCAEEFEVTDTAETEPGTVMVLDQHGALQSSQHAYDKRVAGVISGAGAYRPGLILDRQESSETRVPVALVGKVYCKVDANYAPVEIGDMLTTSPTRGHAMKAVDAAKSFGAVIGKALRPMSAGEGLIPVLVALQ